MPEALDFDRDGLEWPNRERSRFVETDGLRWHVQLAGDGPPLLLLHGTGASTHSWAGLIPLLAQRFTVIAPDLPGQGFSRISARQDLSMAGMARALRALLDVLDLEPRFAVGHSAGAAILARMSIDRQLDLKSITSLNGAFIPFGGVLTRLFSPLAKLLTLNPFVPQLFAWSASDRSAVERLLKSTGSAIPEESLALYQRLFSTPSHVSSTLAMMASWDLESLLRDLPRLQTPLLLIVGENDLTVSPDSSKLIARLAPSSHIIRLPNLGHLAHEERPAEIADLIASRTAETGTGAEIPG
ncbi:MAG: alpha/beta fold hydrolase BchO [Deltaproteobacteria bacterium]